MNRHSSSLRPAPLKQNEQSWRRGKDGKPYEARAKKQQEWQAFLGTTTTRPVPGNVGSLPPRERKAKEMTSHEHIPFDGKSAWKDKECKTPEQFRNGKRMGQRRKPQTQIVGIF